MITLAFTAALSLGAGIWTLRLNPERLPEAEKIPRERYFAAGLALFDLLCCVPHARPIAFDWMLPLLYPAAVAGAVLGFLFLDYLFSRAFGGLLILAAYSIVHGAWEFSLPAAGLFCIAAWLFGGFGIAISGKPCWMRDVIRKCAGKPAWKWTVGAAFSLNGLLMLAGFLILVCR